MWHVACRMQSLSRRCCHFKTHLRRLCTTKDASSSKISSSIPIESLRNIGISAHIDSGKTTVTERILYYGGRIDEMHEVKGKDQVGATMDFMELERQRGITIQSAATHVTWKDTFINVIDTPGHVDFTVEVERALRVLDGAILVLCSVAGVQCQTYTVNRQMARYNVPCIAFLNKLDRQNASAYRTLDMMRKNLGHNAAFMQLPIGKESNFEGIIDLLKRRAIYFRSDDGSKVEEGDIPKHMIDETEEKRLELIEHVSNADDILGEMFLSEKMPSDDELIAAIRRTTIKRKFTPVYMGSALKNKGVQQILDAVVSFLPNPYQVENFANKKIKDGEKKILLNPERSNQHPFVGFAFKLESGPFGQLTYFRAYQGHLKRSDVLTNVRTGRKVRIVRLVRMHANKMEDIEEAFAGDIFAVFGVDCATGDTFLQDPTSGLSCESIFVPAPVVSMSIKTKGSKDGENFLKALNRFTKEDPTFHKMYNTESKETIISGMGELHLEIYAQRMKNEYNCDVEMGKPKVAFRETLAETSTFEYFHKKQSGGAGQYAKVVGLLEPLPPNKNLDLEFQESVYGGSIPKNFIPAIDKSFRETCQAGGPLIGQIITGIRMRVVDGAHHIVDSSDLAFALATKYAIHDTFSTARWILIEPVMSVEVLCPLENHQDVLVLLSKRQAVITESRLLDRLYSINCEAPLNDMFGFVGDLRRTTQGKGEYSMEYVRYTPVRQDIAERLISRHRDEQALETDEKRGKKKKN